MPPEIPQQPQKPTQSPEKRDMLTSLRELHQEKMKPSETALRETIEARKKDILDFLAAAPTRADRFERERALDKAVQQLEKENPKLTEDEIYIWIYGKQVLDNLVGHLETIMQKKDSIPMFLLYSRLKRDYWRYMMYYFEHVAKEPYAEDLLDIGHGRLDFDRAQNIFQKFSKFEKEPYAERVVRAIAAKNPYQMLGFADVFIQQPYGPDIVRKLLIQHFKAGLEALILTHAHRISALPEYRDILKKAVTNLNRSKNYQSLLVNAKAYIQEPYGRDVLAAAVAVGVDIAPGLVILASPYFSQEPYAAGAIEKAIRKLPEFDTQQIVFLFDRLELFIATPFAEAFMAEAASVIPREVFLSSNLYFDQPWASSILQHAVYELLAKKSPYTVLEHLEDIAREPYFADVLEKIVEIDPVAALSSANRADTRAYWPPELVEKAIKKAEDMNLAGLIEHCHTFLNKPYAGDIFFRGAQEFPYITLKWTLHYKDKPYTDVVIREAAARAPLAVLDFYQHFQERPYADTLLERAAHALAKENPEQFLMRVNVIQDKPYAQEIVENAMESTPVTALHLWGNVELFARGSKRPAIQKLVELSASRTADASGNVMAFFDSMVHERMTYEQAEALSKQPAGFDKMIDLIHKPDVLGRNTLSSTLASKALQFVRDLNDLHELPSEKRFESVNNMTSLALYTLMVYGENELFTSSFNGLFDRLVEKMKMEKRTGRDLLDGVGKNKFRTFIKLCSQFNRLNEFLDMCHVEDRETIMQEFVRNIDGAKDKLSEAVTVADTFASINDDQLLHIIQTTVKGEYERTQKEKSVEGAKLYGLLAGMFGERAVIDETWYEQMAAKYKLEDTTHLETKELYNPDGSNVQEYFFYNDNDGKGSFESFLNQYKGQPGWKIKDFETYILISGAKNGKRVLMYANKPEHQGTGNEDIEKALEAAKIETIVLVHRGHSYHVLDTIAKITPRARIVALGSCGGYNNITKVLEKSPRAHILSTKGTGTMLVNDPVYKMLNEEILESERIDWPVFWEKMRKKIGNNKDFDNYVAPHKNLGVMFLKAYRNLRG